MRYEAAIVPVWTRASLDLPHHAGLAERAFQRGAIPFGGIGSGFIGALQELQQGPLRFCRYSHGVIGQDEFAKRLAEERGVGTHLRGAESRRLRIGIGIERRIIDRAAAGPEAGAADLVRIGFTDDVVGQIRYAAGMTRRAPAREARHREVEAAPEEMHGARLAKE